MDGLRIGLFDLRKQSSNAMLKLIASFVLMLQGISPTGSCTYRNSIRDPNGAPAWLVKSLPDLDITHNAAKHLPTPMYRLQNFVKVLGLQRVSYCRCTSSSSIRPWLPPLYRTYVSATSLPINVMRRASPKKSVHRQHLYYEIENQRHYLKGLSARSYPQNPIVVQPTCRSHTCLSRPILMRRRSRS